MLRWPSTADRAAVILVAALAASGLTTLLAQQPAAPRPAARASMAQASAPSGPSAPLPGPRLHPEYRSFQPSIADSSASGRATAMGGSHTIVLSTLSLILIVIIIVLLVVK